MAKTILIIGTFDTKAKALKYLQRKIEAEGVQSLLMDVSCKLAPTEFPSDVSCKTIAKECGKDFEEISRLDKVSAVKLMTDGAVGIGERMAAEKKIQGVIGLGGANCAEIACTVMRALPIGFPKLMVTCVASGNVRPYVGTKDIMMANSIGDISLNRITRSVINNAAQAIAHMAPADSIIEEELKPQVCVSTFGVTQPCVERARILLEERGFEVIELHASGTGGMALEELVASGGISGVLDITTSEMVDDLVGGIYSAGPHRLEAAGSMGVPQIISLGALDFGNFGPKETVPQEYKDRNFFFYTPSITLMRTNPEENKILGKKIAEKANACTGPATIMIPQRGFSALDRAGGKTMTRIDGSSSEPWHDETVNSALINAIKHHLDASKVELLEMDAHINDPEFAETAVRLLCEMMKKRN